MILQALNSYYERLEQDPTIGIAPYGFSRQRVSFRVILENNGELHSVEPLGVQDGPRRVPELIIVPGDGSRSGSTPKPFFLWDNALYLFGIPPIGRTKKWAAERFEAFRDQHLQYESSINDPAFSAVCKFLESWTPGDQRVDPAVLGSYYGVFKLRNSTQNLHERSPIAKWWSHHATANEHEDVIVEQCLVTGEVAPIARLHTPKIKGMVDKPGAPSEKLLVAVDKNFTAAESFGKTQNLNSPVSVKAAFQYCTALNYLLAPDSKQRVQVGDMTTLFWTERPTKAETLLPWVFEASKSAEDDGLKNELHSVLNCVADGSSPGEFGDRDTPFYLLGLSPNAARISVRLWLVSTLGAIIDNVLQHFADLRMDRSERDFEFPDIWHVVRETVRDPKDIPPLLGGAVLRSVLTGAPYPSMLFSALLRRIRADREVRYLRAAVIKAYLNRNIRFGINPLQKEISMSLDPDRPEPSYHMGRFFAELENTQKDALPDINATIKDRYFGAASATPSSVFPRLIRLSQHHLGKLDVGKRIYHEKRIQDILGKVDDFPAHLNLQHQGLFAVGYYHQRQDIFTKKSSNSNDKE